MGVKQVAKNDDQLLGKMLDVVGDVQAVISQQKAKTVIFMCVEKDVLEELCELFPQTAENIKRSAIKRRTQYMKQRLVNYQKAKRADQISPQPKFDPNDDVTSEEQKHGHFETARGKVQFAKKSEKDDISHTSVHLTTLSGHSHSDDHSHPEIP